LGRGGDLKKTRAAFCVFDGGAGRFGGATVNNDSILQALSGLGNFGETVSLQETRGLKFGTTRETNGCAVGVAATLGRWTLICLLGQKGFEPIETFYQSESGLQNFVGWDFINPTGSHSRDVFPAEARSDFSNDNGLAAP
jgi:hypothetical protein